MFTKLGKIIAWIAFVFGAIRVAMGLSIAFFSTSPQQMAHFTREYIGSGTTGDAIDQGVQLLVVGVVIGILSEISTRLAKHKAAVGGDVASEDTARKPAMP